MVRAGAKFVLLSGLYLVLAGQVSTDEVIAALLAGAAATGLALAVPRVAARHFDFAGVPWARLLLATLRSLASETWQVGLRLLRPRPQGGRIVRWPLQAHGDRRQKAARRGLVTLGLSLTPNGYMLSVLPDREEVLVHQLVPDDPPPNREWPL